jgi:hypothetical protein
MAPAFRRRMRDGALLPAWHDQEDSGHDGAPFRRRIPYAPLGLLKAAFEAALDENLHNCVLGIESSVMPGFSELGLEGRLLGPAVEWHGMQQPVILNIKGSLDNMARVNHACWEVMAGRGELHERADEVWHKSWDDDPPRTPQRGA